jgi:hypothetical protein
MSGYNPDGIICTPEDMAIEFAANANHTSTPLICLNRGQSIGLTVRAALPGILLFLRNDLIMSQLTAEAGFVSGIAVLVIFALIIVMSSLQRCLGYFSYLPEFQRKKRQYPTEHLIKEPMDLFMVGPNYSSSSHLLSVVDLPTSSSCSLPTSSRRLEPS